ncbi:MAG: hypothetical protein GY830_08970 [Bacteroidetes bacterium]|nr:hypothetical protein [Bacteroidota bacterium]
MPKISDNILNEDYTYTDKLEIIEKMLNHFYDKRRRYGIKDTLFSELVIIRYNSLKRFNLNKEEMNKRKNFYLEYYNLEHIIQAQNNLQNNLMKLLKI